MSTIHALIMGAEVAVTDVGVFAGVLNQATAEERANVKNMADLVSLYFQVHDRVHRQVTAQVEELGEQPPPVNLVDFEVVLAENFRRPDQVVPEGITLQ